MAAGTNYSVALTLRANDATGGALSKVGSRLQKLDGQMSVLGRKVGLHKLESALGGLQGRMAGVGKAMSFAFGPLLALGSGIGAGGLLAFAQRAASIGADLDDLSQRTGIGVEKLQEWGYAAKMNGVAPAEFNKSLEVLSRNIGLSANGVGESVEVFKSLGVSLKDSTGKIRPAGAVFEELVSKLDKIKSPAERAALASKLFGDSGAKLIPLMQGEWRTLENGQQVWVSAAQRLEELAAKKRRFGLVTQEQAAASALFMDQWDNIGEALTGLSTVIGATLLPLFGPVLEGMSDWIAGNKEMLGSGIGEFAEFLLDVGGAIGSLVDAVGGLGPALGMLGTVFGPLVIAMAPVSAAVVAIGAAAFLIWKYWEPIKGFFIGLWNDVTSAFDAAVAGMQAALAPVLDFLSPLIAVGRQVVDFYAGIYGNLFDLVSAALGKLASLLPKSLRSMLGLEVSAQGGPPPAASAAPAAAAGPSYIPPVAAPVAGAAIPLAPRPAMSMAPAPAAQRSEAEITLRVKSDLPAHVEGERRSGAGVSLNTDVNVGRGMAGQ